MAWLGSELGGTTDCRLYQPSVLIMSSLRTNQTAVDITIVPIHQSIMISKIFLFNGDCQWPVHASKRFVEIFRPKKKEQNMYWTTSISVHLSWCYFKRIYIVLFLLKHYLTFLCKHAFLQFKRFPQTVAAVKCRPVLV